MPPPGRFEKRITQRTGRTGGITLPIGSRGAGTYILVCDHEVHDLVVNGNRIGGIGNSGRPAWNMIVWHRHSSASNAPTNIAFRAGRPGGIVNVELWLAEPGTPLPRAPGWQPSDAAMHRH